jgi:serine phosphatase RsbU (regulator of sigma subunit)
MQANLGASEKPPRNLREEFHSIPASRATILLVEDSPTQAARFSQLLTQEGFKVIRAASAEAGLRMLETERPNVIILDNHLPNMTGNEFCREIRLNLNTRATPVLMLTAEESNAAEMQGLASGADDYVLKTADPDIFIARVRALLRKSDPDPVVPEVENNFKLARILIIDDDLWYVRLMREALPQYHVEISTDPEEGLRRMAEGNFDCILVDFEMPLLNGAEVCHRIRESQTDSALIMYSAYDDKAKMTEAFEAGADDYISKSSDLSVTRARISALLRRRALVQENRRIADEIRQKEMDAMEARAQRQIWDRELEIAREVQQRLFPQILPRCSTLEYAAKCRPAHAVGGDYYDFFALPGDRLGISLGDVSGKGIPASLLMASLQASVRGQAFMPNLKVSELISNVNRLLYQASPDGQYATFLYAQYDAATRKLIYSNGGHNPPILIRDEKMYRLSKGGPPVGLFEESEYEESEIQLHSGDLLALFTDGICDAENSQREALGDEGLKSIVLAAKNQTPGEIVEMVLSQADVFAAGAAQHDDMTVVVAKVR